MINKKRQELIIQNLGSISTEVRIMAVEQLVQLPAMSSDDKRKYLEKLLADPDNSVRQAVTSAIGCLEHPDAQSASEQFSEVPQQAAEFVIPDIEIPLSAPAVMTSINEPVDPSLPDLKKMTDISSLLDHIRFLSIKKPAGYLTQLLQLSHNVIEEVALTALQNMFNLKDKRVAPQVLVMLADDQYSSQRRFLMLKIIMDTEEDLDSPLLEEILLREKDVIVKSGLVKVFARSSRESGKATLVKCLQDPDPRVRANTVEVIEEQDIKGCEQDIIQLLEDPENRVKVNAAKYLVKNGYQNAFLTLRAMLVSSEVWLRDSVIFALGEIGDQASLTLLKAALKDPNQGIRLSVLKALARINNNTSRQVLKAACGDPDPVVAQVANSLCEKIKDTPLREEITRIAPSITPEKPAVSKTAVPVAAQTQTPVSAPSAASPAAVASPQLVIPPIEKEISPVSQQPSRPIIAPVDSEPKAVSIPVVAKTSPLPSKQAATPSVKIPGAPEFSKPRSAEIYARLCSANLEEQRIGARDIAFVMGDDQMILIEKALSLADESIRIAAVKVLSRKRTPEVKAILQKLSLDENETVRSLAEKTLLILK
ncbi:MAG: HEAT repeat domain-containing protein [Candidatus Riflebacteria bacterium]|nr:HEAT repeat domain-containing protein [Candidatus Riflebacteria bacterium]